MIVLQHAFHHFELSTRDRLQHEEAIVRIIEERSALAGRAELRQRLKVALENVSKDFLRTKTLQVLLFRDA